MVNRTTVKVHTGPDFEFDVYFTLTKGMKGDRDTPDDVDTVNLISVEFNGVQVLHDLDNGQIDFLESACYESLENGKSWQL